MRVAKELTPEVLLSAPRRTPAIPSPDGSLALYLQSTHSFEDTETFKEVRIMNLESGASEQLIDAEHVREAQWLPGTPSHVVYLKSGDEGATQVWIADAADPSRDHYVAAEYNAPISALKLKSLQDGSVAIVVAGLVGSDGGLFNGEVEKPKSTGRIFDEYHVRTVSRFESGSPGAAAPCD